MHQLIEKIVWEGNKFKGGKKIFIFFSSLFLLLPQSTVNVRDMSAGPGLLCLAFFLINIQHARSYPPNGVVCNPVGDISCVCRHPDGIIDLIPLANWDGTPRYYLDNLGLNTDLVTVVSPFLT